MLNRLLVIKGSQALRIPKGVYLKVEQDPEHTGGGVYMIKCSFMYNGLQRRTLYARFWERYFEFNMNNGDPTKKIRVQKA